MCLYEQMYKIPVSEKEYLAVFVKYKMCVDCLNFQHNPQKVERVSKA